MIICGLKFTHDGAIALIDNGKLIFSYEMEKLNNNARYSTLLEFYNDDFLDAVLSENGYRRDQIDQFVIDGWGDESAENKTENDHACVAFTLIKSGSKNVTLSVNSYGMMVKNEEVLKPRAFICSDDNFSYNSYLHVSSHIFGSYCTSQFAKNKESSFILVWDGGMLPQLFYFNAQLMKVENQGSLFHLMGDSYAILGSNYYPFDNSKDNKTVAGKLMAYIALGEVDQQALLELKRIFDLHEINIKSLKEANAGLVFKSARMLLKEFLIYGEVNEIDPKNLLATYHVFFQEIILYNLREKVSKYPGYAKNICLSGGCALNIKWNSQIRESGIFEEVWIPPFPNDSGNAIGAACCEMIHRTGELVLRWDVYSGPFIKEGVLNTDWIEEPCSLEQLARILYFFEDPVLFLNGRAELGPRALGNRSILASPVSITMKAQLNDIKNREDYRPVAPICLEKDAPDIFSPGFPDPFMLFEHKVREEWKDRIPAVCHIDGTARLQTVNESQNSDLAFLLQKFKEFSGIPLLCNTSANLSGSGFFPDLESAMKWGKVGTIWSNSKVYFKKSNPSFSEKLRILSGELDRLTK